jgi:hypothetical protein
MPVRQLIHGVRAVAFHNLGKAPSYITGSSLSAGSLATDVLIEKLDIILREQAILGGEPTIESWKKNCWGICSSEKRLA